MNRSALLKTSERETSESFEATSVNSKYPSASSARSPIVPLESDNVQTRQLHSRVERTKRVRVTRTDEPLDRTPLPFPHSTRPIRPSSSDWTPDGGAGYDDDMKTQTLRCLDECQERSRGQDVMPHVKNRFSAEQDGREAVFTATQHDGLVAASENGWLTLNEAPPLRTKLQRGISADYKDPRMGGPSPNLVKVLWRIALELRNENRQLKRTMAKREAAEEHKLSNYKLATKNMATTVQELQNDLASCQTRIISLENADDRRNFDREDLISLQGKLAAAEKQAEEMRELQRSALERERKHEEEVRRLKELIRKQPAAECSEPACAKELETTQKALADLRAVHDLKVEELDFAEYLNRLLCEWVWEHECKIRNLQGEEAKLHLFWTPNRSPWLQKVGDRYMHGRLLAEGEQDIIRV